MKSEPDKKFLDSKNLIDQVDNLAEQAKTMALNLALTLAHEKSKIKDLKVLEPEFTRMINKSVGVIREITKILGMLRSDKPGAPQTPINSERFDKIETSMEEILDVSKNVLKDIRALKQRKDMVDKYK